MKLPDTSPKPNPNCAECCTCNKKQQKDKETKCLCFCKCFGYFHYDDWGFDPKTDLPNHLKIGSIKIIYRSKIRVFYRTKQEALDDGYNDFNQHATNGQYVYPFSGLRGDSKELYQKVLAGRESRIQLVRAGTPELQAVHVSKADVVIWACGYQTNRIPIKDQEGREIQLSQNVAFT